MLLSIMVLGCCLLIEAFDPRLFFVYGQQQQQQQDQMPNIKNKALFEYYVPYSFYKIRHESNVMQQQFHTKIRERGFFRPNLVVVATTIYPSCITKLQTRMQSPRRPWFVYSSYCVAHDPR